MTFNFDFVSEYMPYFINGIKYTILISVISVISGVILGSLLCFMKKTTFKIGKFNPISFIATAYIEIIRGTPMLLQILIVYTAFDQLLGTSMEALTAAIIAVSLNSGAYVSEVIRGGIDGVDKGQFEAARSLGMNKTKTMILVVIPQAIRSILPAIGNEFVTVIKDSSMASTIGVGELMYASKVVTGATFRGLEPLIIAAGFYFVITFTLGRILSLVERRMKVSDAR